MEETGEKDRGGERMGMEEGGRGREEASNGEAEGGDRKGGREGVREGGRWRKEIDGLREREGREMRGREEERWREGEEEWREVGGWRRG